MQSKAPMVMRYGSNIHGRDFVVGDIHGAFYLLLIALDRIDFDPIKDRLFSVGDLIDRGDDSARVTEFLKLPFVFAVRGNHESWLLKLHENDKFPMLDKRSSMVQNLGLEWWVDTPVPKKLEILEAIGKLPVVIEIETPRGTVGIVHAEVPIGMKWADFIHSIESKYEWVLEHALWGRSRIESNNIEGVEGIGRLFVGHTIQWDGLNQFGNIFAIDTGAIFAGVEDFDGAHLTIINLIHTTGLPSPPVELISIFNNPVIDRPFEGYTNPHGY